MKSLILSLLILTTSLSLRAEDSPSIFNGRYVKNGQVGSMPDFNVGKIACPNEIKIQYKNDNVLIAKDIPNCDGRWFECRLASFGRVNNGEYFHRQVDNGIVHENRVISEYKNGSLVEKYNTKTSLVRGHFLKTRVNIITTLKIDGNELELTVDAKKHYKVKNKKYSCLYSKID